MPLDLEEQEQVADLKAWWNQHGTWIVIALSAAVLAFSGWMDGGDVSTGTVRRLVDLLGAKPFADIDPCGFPGLRVTQLADLGVVRTPATAGAELAPMLAAQLTRR